LRRYALKSIRLDRTQQKANGTAVSTADEAELRNEIAVLRSLDHPHIVHIIETYEYRRSIYLLIDLCEGGDLYVMDPYTEGEARGIMKQLCQAVSYMHRRGVVHRDLKYENVMFVDCADRSRMSIKVRCLHSLRRI
jgi:serine/threonine protein kinase